MASTERFGYEWEKFDTVLAEHETQFLKWVFPLGQEDFKGKRTLDAGCGMGRNSFWVLKYGASEAVAFDFDRRSVESARKNLSSFSNATVNFHSIYEDRYHDEFDVVFSIGVIHHLERPEEAVRRLKSAVKPGGRVLIWVYGYEGNEWIVRFVSPIRRLITSRIPPALLNALTYGVSVPFSIFIRMAPTTHPYLRQMKGFGFHHVHSIIFDQLLPSVANYWRRNEARSLFERAGLGDIEIHRVNQNSWTVLGRKIQRDF